MSRKDKWDKASLRHQKNGFLSELFMVKNKLISDTLFFIVLVGTLLQCLPIKAEDHPRDMVFPSVVFSPPMGDRVVLKNGMTLFILEDHELPLVNLTAIIRTGSVYDPPKKSGLAEITGNVMRIGGTASLSPKEVSGRLEYVGVLMKVEVGNKKGFDGTLSKFGKVRTIELEGDGR